MPSLNEQDKKCVHGSNYEEVCSQCLTVNASLNVDSIFPTHKTEEEKMREEFESKFDDYMDFYSKGEFCDWWLNKIEQIKSTAYEQGVRDTVSKFEKLGDFAHEQYLGCTCENGIWNYGYKNEVVYILDEFIKKFINNNKE